jgi:dTDP-4-dehydrorhamnose reductase
LKLLITGAGGQLGQAFVHEIKHHPDITVVACSRSDLDIADEHTVRQLIVQERPDFVINTAAYTQVDLAETETEKAYLVNQIGPANLAQVCQDLDIPLIHFSTDCVFDGSKQGAWTEVDPTGPLSIYGASKLAGEEAVQQRCIKHMIFRVSWVFSEFAHNFVKTMLHLGSTREQLRVVSDQIGKPTCAREIARVVLEILPKHQNQWGLYHLAQPDVTSWHGFAQAVFHTAGHHPAGIPLIVKEVLPIPTSGYPTPAERPANSTLDTTKLQKTFGLGISNWQQSLSQTLSVLESQALTFNIEQNNDQTSDQTSE